MVTHVDFADLVDGTLSVARTPDASVTDLEVEEEERGREVDKVFLEDSSVVGLEDKVALLMVEEVVGRFLTLDDGLVVTAADFAAPTPSLKDEEVTLIEACRYVEVGREPTGGTGVLLVNPAERPPDFKDVDEAVRRGFVEYSFAEGRDALLVVVDLGRTDGTGAKDIFCIIIFSDLDSVSEVFSAFSEISPSTHVSFVRAFSSLYISCEGSTSDTSRHRTVSSVLLMDSFNIRSVVLLHEVTSERTIDSS